MSDGIFLAVFGEETYLTEQILGVLIDRRYHLSNGKLLQPNPVALETAHPIREQSQASMSSSSTASISHHV